MILPIEMNPLAGVFGFLDGALPQALRKAAEETDLGIGRILERDVETFVAISIEQHRLTQAKDAAAPLGLYATGEERRAIAKILNETFRLQWRECPLRKFLAKYRLFHRDDMADALAAAYCLHKRGCDPKAALTADYAMGFHGLLFHEDIEKFREAPKDSYEHFFWNHLRSHSEPGDRVVSYVWRPYDGYLLVRGDRLVWEVESIHKCMVGISLKWQAETDHFIALGSSKAFLNGEFVWPPTGWVNPVSDAEEKASLSKRPMFDLKGQSPGEDATAAGSPC